jgi:hypothetical protein
MADRTCSIDGCDRKAYARGWCNTHYSAWWHRGDAGATRKVNRCSVEGCERAYYGNGFCGMHRQRWLKSGDPLIVSQIRGDDHRRLMSKVTVVPETGCWVVDLWKGARYGRVVYKGRKWLAHRAFYDLLVGPIPEGLTLDHLCRNTPCVNPEHLEPVTQRENNLRADDSPTTQNARKTHCKRGHEFTPENTTVCNGSRYCRACMRRRYRESRAKAQEAS